MAWYFLPPSSRRDELGPFKRKGPPGFQRRVHSREETNEKALSEKRIGKQRARPKISKDTPTAFIATRGVGRRSEEGDGLISSSEKKVRRPPMPTGSTPRHALLPIFWLLSFSPGFSPFSQLPFSALCVYEAPRRFLSIEGRGPQVSRRAERLPAS